MSRRADFGGGALRADGSRAFVHPADVSGRWTTRRWFVFGFLIAIYVALPWIQMGGHPAVFLDIGHRRFFLFGWTFNAQDAWLVFFLVSGAGFGLIALTAVLGRVWCGYACPQTVWLEGVYRRIERWIEGPRDARMKLREGPWSFDRVWKFVLKQFLFLAISILLAHVFLSYFTSLPELFRMVGSDPGSHPEAFGWVAGLTGLLYFNFAWFREQFCVIVCPYGRLQSLLTDRDSIIIGYDERRGEPRGKAGTSGAGDCVDCGRCVVVCPTAIDIRRGLQLECVGCAACIDACDEIMDRLNRPRGLVRYDSQSGLEGSRRRLLRPRLWIYLVLLAVGATVAAFSFTSRSEFEANLLRLPGPPFVADEDGVRNSFELHLVNKSNGPAQFEILGEGRGLSYIISVPKPEVASLEGLRIPVFVSHHSGKRAQRVRLQVRRIDPRGETLVVSAPFLGPGHSSP